MSENVRVTVDVPCPKCGAATGFPCRTPSGVIRRDYPHKRRHTAYLRALRTAAALGEDAP